MKTSEKKLLTKEECKEIQFKILQQVASICDENNLVYCMCGGTMLGAVRHKGFIPWDDDIDICLPRQDYEKLISLLKKQKQCEWLEVIDDSQKGYYYTFAKAVNNTTITKLKDSVIQYGIWIDLFPIDSLPQNKIKRNILIYKCFLLRAIILAMTTDFNTTENNKKKVVKKILNQFAKIIGKEKIFSYYKSILKKTERYENSKYVACLFPRYGKREIFKREILFTRTEYVFENKKFYGPKDYHTYLSGLYGEYMKLPPENERYEHGIIAWKL